MAYYITQQMLENRLSSAVVRRIYDDNNDGTVDAAPLTQVIDDAERRFETAVHPIYPDLVALRAGAITAASSVVLDLAEALAAKRFPRAISRAWEPLLADALLQLKELRNTIGKLPVQGSPNPPANVGGQVELPGSEAVATDNEPVWRDGFGAF